MTQLFWQPPAVTKCGDCFLASTFYQQCGHQWSARFAAQSNTVYLQNKNGITPTCPMWIEQNKETPNANT